MAASVSAGGRIGTKAETSTDRAGASAGALASVVNPPLVRVKSIARRSKENSDARFIPSFRLHPGRAPGRAGLASAQKLDKDDKTFLDDVRPILLEDEDKTYKGLKEKSDRLEFQKIFWARRDPDLATPANEYQAEYEKARAEADRLYRMPAQAGSLTDCGRVFILLGKPDEVQQEGGTPGARPAGSRDLDLPRPAGTHASRAARRRSRSTRSAALRPPSRRRWTAWPASLVVQPSLDYKKGKDGRLVKLADMLPKDTPARALLKQPRQDFPTALQAGVPQDRGRRHGAARARARRGRGSRRERQRRGEDAARSRSARAPSPRTARNRAGRSRRPACPSRPTAPSSRASSSRCGPGSTRSRPARWTRRAARARSRRCRSRCRTWRRSSPARTAP